MTCTAETVDNIWRNTHFCTQTTDHDEHICLCGYKWAKPQ